jgi:hypothetical protein
MALFSNLQEICEETCNFLYNLKQKITKLPLNLVPSKKKPKMAKYNKINGSNKSKKIVSLSNNEKKNNWVSYEHKRKTHKSIF